jgi:hypothetical protein
VKATVPTQRLRVVHVPSPWLGVLMLAALVAALGGIAFGVFYVWLTTAPPEVKVPDVTRINIRAAEDILARRGLIGQVTAHRYDQKLVADTVISSSPLAGKTVRQGRVVELIVSDGPPTVTIPDLREIELDRASEAISRADLHLARIRRRYDESLPAGWVMEQQPAPGTKVARRADVVLTVSAGPKPEALPSPESPGETPGPPGPASEDLGAPHYAVVQVTLPEGDEPAEVRIEVEDKRGVTVAYKAAHEPGSIIAQVVTGYGDATARVYVNDNLIEEKRF